MCLRHVIDFTLPNDLVLIQKRLQNLSLYNNYLRACALQKTSSESRYLLLSIILRVCSFQYLLLINQLRFVEIKVLLNQRNIHERLVLSIEKSVSIRRKFALAKIDSQIINITNGQIFANL